MATRLDQTMATDEEKLKLAKLLQGLEVPEVKLTENCRDIVNLFHEKFDKEVEEEEMRDRVARETETFDENPYKVDKGLLEENERKLRELLAKGKRAKKEYKESVLSGADPMRPWRTHTSKEKLLRIDNELKRHHEVGSQAIAPMADGDMRDLVKECQEETQLSAKISAERLRDSVDSAKRNLPNFQYRKIDNGTATAILPEAHEPPSTQDVTMKN
ncbi:uncharacterized protein LOC134791067 [Cydia splendana]|uniref:uncharacterized protein LOC134791067 n=1 Tax=Cydia splendana TaxID=1100963 RepID=UPI00212F2A94